MNLSSPREPLWSYEEAFSRNLGLISPTEQQKLRHSRVAIAGLGGVGGIDLVTLARLGIGAFTIADPDIFEVPNINRQYGASISTIGRSKSLVMADIVRDINPEVDLRIFTEPLGPHNAREFLQNADLFLDAIEFFEIDVRRVLFKEAAAKNIYAITAGPVGFSAIWLVFSPSGMSFDRYFDFSENMGQTEKLAAFVVGVAPRATHRSYLDMRMVDVKARVGPSSSLACHLASGAMACEVVKILLQRGRVRTAPCYQQFDAYLGHFVQGRLWRGNRHPLQRLKRRWVTRLLTASDGQRT